MGGQAVPPPLTDIPVGAYILAAGFDLISFFGEDQEWARDFYRAATFTLIGGVIFGALAAVTGFWDWLKSTEKGTQARRTVNAHAWTMVIVTVLVLVDIGLRRFAYDSDTYTGLTVLILSLAVALLTILGATIGGGLTYEYGFNVETAGDSPVWHQSEVDVLPGQKG